MKKHVIILWILSCSFYAMGQNVTESLAIKMANAYYQEVKLSRGDTTMVIPTKDVRVPERFSLLGKADMWLVPIEDGWILLSSSIKVAPILAHIQSKERPIYEDFPPAAKELLNIYEEKIAYVNEHETDFNVDQRWLDVAYSDTQTNRTAASTMTEVTLPLNVHWGQTKSLANSCDKAYNKFCPYVYAPEQCNKAAAGCVAVAIAQIMWYWKWPYAAYVPTTVGGSTTELKFYDWSKMPSKIDNNTTIDKVDMIAGFLRDCGYSLDMDYGISSGAYDNDALTTLENFGYDANTMELKHKTSSLGWTNLLRSNIDNGQPVYYSGMSALIGGRGHAFIVDGYRTGHSPIYHINWGWRGIADNWYNIDDAYVNDSTHYEYFQAAIFGIRPAPICYDVALNGNVPSFPSKFCLAVGGDITIANRTFSNVVQGEIYSSSQVRLTSGVTIQQGSNVHIAIKNIPCPTNTSFTPDIQSLQERAKYTTKDNVLDDGFSFSIKPNPVCDILIVMTTKKLSHISIFNLNGQRVLQTSELEIEVANLPAGVYMLRAVTTDGQIYQDKFLKQ